MMWKWASRLIIQWPPSHISTARGWIIHPSACSELQAGPLIDKITLLVRWNRIGAFSVRFGRFKNDYFGLNQTKTEQSCIIQAVTVCNWLKWNGGLSRDLLNLFSDVKSTRSRRRICTFDVSAQYYGSSP